MDYQHQLLICLYDAMCYTRLDYCNNDNINKQIETLKSEQDQLNKQHKITQKGLNVAMEEINK